MKITVNDKDVLILSDTQKKVIKNDIHLDEFEKDMRRRLSYWANDNIFGKTLKRLKKKWDPILAERGVQSMPTDLEAYAIELIKQPEFQGIPSDTESAVKVDDVSEFTISPTKKKIMRCCYKRTAPDDFLEKELAWVLNHKYERCMERLRLEWEPKLIARGAQSLPTDDEKFALLVFAEPDYKDRKTRDAEKV